MVSNIDKEKFEKFISLILEWNRVHNLTGAKSRRDIYLNIEDSYYPYNFITKPKSILDIGSGAGFPAIILAIIYPRVRVVLSEPRNKRASFLKFVALELKLDNVIVVKKRVEEYNSEPFNLITSRAVMSTKRLIDLTSHLRNSDTKYLLYKGDNILNELKEITSMDYDIIDRGKRKYLYIKKVKNDI